ncbi:hypothetical protein [Pseudomonas sp. WS 5011]|uniref:hypothetical protein n=1 Tax=Pseudomonas sp. WS 5011 TaxID=2717477 RepID=UPI001474F9D5|nr:hypothetical protein [Pseudomonas sp. WS 5011]NMY53129.1 hypothetical protein [Pseudomonas sp. WS 5011]
MGHLTPKDEKRIIKLIEEWPEPKLTWPLLVDACKEKLGISRARQSLMNLPAVDLAMKNAKAGLKAKKLKPGWISDIQAANERIEELTATNQKLAAAVRDMHSRFLIWQANADMHGLTQSMLERPVSQLKKKT